MRNMFAKTTNTINWDIHCIQRNVNTLLADNNEYLWYWICCL